jgi:hypothetical protein
MGGAKCLGQEGKVYLGGTLSAAIADEEIRTHVETVPGVQKVLTDFATIPAKYCAMDRRRVSLAHSSPNAILS